MNELFDKILYRAITQNATDIHLYFKDKLKIQFRIFGKLYLYEWIDYDVGSRLMNFIKYKASINTNYRLLPQTGDFHTTIQHQIYALRISFLPSIDFESIVIRILNNHKPISLYELTMLENVQNYLESLINQESGLFLICGATGSGKSTTLYALIDEISKQGIKNIITIEDPIEMKKEGCIQIELNEKLGITYQQTLHQILRHDPDVIVIGEIRNVDTAKIAVTCALTGHLVLTTIHASNARMALKRLMNLGVSQVDLQDVLIGSMAQKLKYDIENKRVIVLAEILDHQQIDEYIAYGTVTYDDFKVQIEKLVKKGIDKNLFKGEYQ